ncbi:hypothetical protein LIER_31239 [Lithospermum erythrorhizon]|uniref:Uncharacterized protein n=1 Tax=Lithospermum erythrorhizon TaxID=34254 RepID=A0AAV3RQA9_LITER
MPSVVAMLSVDSPVDEQLVGRPTFVNADWTSGVDAVSASALISCFPDQEIDYIYVNALVFSSFATPGNQVTYLQQVN